MDAYVDANVLVYSTLDDQRGEQARAALRDLETGATSMLAIDEAVWALRRADGMASAIHTARLWLDSPRLVIVPIGAAEGRRALDLMERPGLKPRDALHAAAALERSLPVLSDDGDFDSVERLTRLPIAAGS